MRIEADPDELRDFAGKLKDAQDKVNSIKSALESVISDLEQGWQDEVGKKVLEQLQQPGKWLAAFIDEANGGIDLLNNKAEALEYYQGK